jgi:CubicO group peptidase (beta-lactamase class C family)
MINREKDINNLLIYNKPGSRIIQTQKGKVILLLILTLLTFPFTYIRTQSLQQKLDKYLVEYQNNKNVASISAGVLKKGKIIWLGSYGYADINNRIKANSNTLYRIASISKVITSVAIMQLVEQKKIDLDTDALRYIPYFPHKKWKFTTRQILQHTAGLRSYKNGEFNNTISYSSTQQAVEVISNDSLEYKPGSKYLYTTLGYNLLAAVIENVSKMKFADYLKKYIFEPADMKATFPEYHKEIVLNKALGYIKNNYRILQNAPQSDVSIKIAGGGLISTTEDLLKFANCLLNGKLLKHATLDSMLVPTILPDGKILESGLGFDIKTDYYGKQFFGHYGHGTGFMSLLVIYPKDSVAVVDLINTADRSIDSPAENLAAIAQGKPFPIPKKSLADKMMEITLHKNIDSAIKFLNTIKKDSSEEYDLTSDEYDLFGYDLLRIQHGSDAIRWFQLFENDFPGNISALIGTGDSYYHNGNKDIALRYYRKVLKLDSSNIYSIKMIKTLEKSE